MRSQHVRLSTVLTPESCRGQRLLLTQLLQSKGDAIELLLAQANLERERGGGGGGGERVGEIHLVCALELLVYKLKTCDVNNYSLYIVCGILIFKPLYRGRPSTGGAVKPLTPPCSKHLPMFIRSGNGVDTSSSASASVSALVFCRKEREVHDFIDVTV